MAWKLKITKVGDRAVVGRILQARRGMSPEAAERQIDQIEQGFSVTIAGLSASDARDLQSQVRSAGGAAEYVRGNAKFQTSHETQSEEPDSVQPSVPLQPSASLQTRLSGKVRHYVKKRNVLLPGEVVEAVLVGGTGSQAILVTNRRLVVVKVGFFAGSTGGGRATSFDFGDVVALQVQLGMMMGSLSVQSKGYGATQVGDYWDLQKDKRVLDLPNVIVWSKTDDKKYAAELAYAHSKIAAAGNTTAGTPTQVASPDTATVADRLHRLDDLRQQGLVTEDEYADQRQRILGDL